MKSVEMRFTIGALLVAAVRGNGLRNKFVEGNEKDFEMGIDAYYEKVRYGSSTVDLGYSRIIGGYNAAIGEFPFFAEWGASRCGGALITEDVVLTAAHCEAGVTTNTLYIGGVESTVDITTGDPRGGVKVQIAQRAIHPSYHQLELENDFALLKLTEKVNGRTPITPNSDDDFPVDGQELIVMGYGVQQEGWGFQPDSLQKVAVQKTSDEMCFDQYGPLPFDIMFCAGVEGGGKDSCQGDSGGPIITRDAFNNMKIVGVVSFGIGCGRAEAHGVYARVSGVYDWIVETACDTLNSADDTFCGRPVATARPSQTPTKSPTHPPSQLPTKSPTAHPSQPPILPKTPVPTASPVTPIPSVSFAPSVSSAPSSSYAPTNVPTASPVTPVPSVSLAPSAPSVSSAPSSSYTPTSFPTDSPVTPFPSMSVAPSAPSVSSAPSSSNVPTGTPTTSPTPKCEDLEGTFEVDENVGEQDCEWLKTIGDPSYINFMCRLISVASVCRDFCDACHFFE